MSLCDHAVGFKVMNAAVRGTSEEHGPEATAADRSDNGGPSRCGRVRAGAGQSCDYPFTRTSSMTNAKPPIENCVM